jgi:putative hemolysin
MEIAAQIVIILLLLLLNGVLAMAELAIVSARKARLQQRAEAGSAGARAALELANAPTHFLSTVQVGITLVGILAGAFGGATLAEELAKLLRPVFGQSSDAVSLVLVVLAITYLSLIIGELVPKRLALSHAETLATILARPMRWLATLVGPAVRFLSFSTDLMLRLLRIRPSGEPPVTEEEIKIMLEQATEAGVVEEAEQKMVESVFRLADRRVDEIMTPRPKIVWLDLDAPMDENWRRIAASRHSHFPVYQGKEDNVVGLVSVKDLWARRVDGLPVDLQAVVRMPLLVPESMPALKVLELFRTTGTHLGIVIDEYGSVQGLVTIIDLMEALVGALPERGEHDERHVVQRNDGSWLLDGTLTVDEFQHILNIAALPAEQEGEYQTLGGFVMAHLARIPRSGDYFDWQGYRFEVMDMDGNRVDKVLVALALQPPDPPEPAAEVPVAPRAQATENVP